MTQKPGEGWLGTWSRVSTSGALKVEVGDLSRHYSSCGLWNPPLSVTSCEYQVWGRRYLVPSQLATGYTWLLVRASPDQIEVIAAHTVYIHIQSIPYPDDFLLTLVYSA